MKTSIAIKELPVKNGMVSKNLYILNAPVFYPVVHEPKDNWDKTGKEFSVTIFVDEETKDKLLDEVMVNKTFSKVGVDKTSKPPRRIKYPLSSQVEEGKAHYDEVDGMYGFNVTKNELSKAGNKMFVNVIDKDGKPFKENVGNNSVCNIKLFGYENRDSQLVVSLDTVQVVEHVAYEGKTNDGTVTDDVLGVSYQVGSGDKEEQSAPKQQTQQEEDFDSDIPF